MPVLASCDDEPPEPLIDHSKDYFCSIVLVEAGVPLTLFRTHPATTRANPPKRKVKARELRPLRPLVYLATLLGEGRRLQSFTSLWRCSVRSLQYKQPYWEISPALGVFGDTKPVLTSPPHSLTVPVTFSEPHPTSKIAIDGVAKSPLGKRSFSIPCIVVTSPADEDFAVSLNLVSTQDARHGNLLTVPDPDLEVINQSNHARTLFDSPYLRRERLYSFPGACKKPRIPLVLAEEFPVVTCTIWKSNLASFQEDEDEALDLGPTWSG